MVPFQFQLPSINLLLVLRNNHRFDRNCSSRRHLDHLRLRHTVLHETSISRIQVPLFSHRQKYHYFQIDPPAQHCFLRFDTATWSSQIIGRKFQKSTCFEFGPQI